jgi:hypothetical protein
VLQNRVECQLRTPCVPRTAREVAHCICRHTHGMPPEAIAAQAGIPLKRFMKISAPQGDTLARVEEIAAVTRVTGRTEWLRFYVRQAGCELFLLPDLQEHGEDAELLEQTSASLQSLSAVVEKLREITRDRRVEAEEQSDFDGIVGKHLSIVRRLQAWVTAHVDKPSTTRRRG